MRARVLVCAHALHANAERWLINEKGAVTAAGRLPGAPESFGQRAHAALGSLGTTGGSLEAAINDVERLIADTIVACESS